MQGDYTYCMKHGHDWQPIYKAGAMALRLCRCSICGAEQVRI